MGIEETRNDLYHYQNQANSARTWPQTQTLVSMPHTQLQTPSLFHPATDSRNFFCGGTGFLDLLGKVMLVSHISVMGLDNFGGVLECGGLFPLFPPFFFFWGCGVEGICGVCALVYLVTSFFFFLFCSSFCFH